MICTNCGSEVDELCHSAKLLFGTDDGLCPICQEGKHPAYNIVARTRALNKFMEEKGYGFIGGMSELVDTVEEWQRQEEKLVAEYKEKYTKALYRLGYHDDHERWWIDMKMEKGELE